MYDHYHATDWQEICTVREEYEGHSHYMMQDILWEVSPVILEQHCIDKFIHVIGELADIYIIKVPGELLTWIVIKVLRICLVTPEVSMIEIALFQYKKE